MPGTPFAYIRRSSASRSNPGDVSREFQSEEVRRLSGHDDALVILDGDWGKSAATDSTDKRLDFLHLLELVERGQVSAIYAYSTDRLARSVEWAARLLNACRRAGTVIVTGEGRFEPDNATTDQLFYFQAMQNEGYSRQQVVKNRSRVNRMRASGRKMGAPYYGRLTGESLETVLATYERVGTINGTAIELNRIGLPARRSSWGSTTVKRILAREGLVPESGVRGAKHRADHYFHQLLRCHCGRTMTGSRRSSGLTAYRCIPGETLPDHGRKFVAERGILEWAQRETARLRPPSDAVSMAEAAAEEAIQLRARLERAKRMYLDGDMDRAEYEAERTSTQAEVTRLDLQGRAERIPTFVWDDDARQTNLDLRALWSHVELDRHLRPVRAGWLVPAAWLAPRASE